MDAVVIGGMKCGTTALHRYLAGHPEVRAAEAKELNFFFGDRPGSVGNWWRDPDWYAQQFQAGPGLRVEASPGYTSPDHPEVARRMRAVVPEVRSLYIARPPFERAVSQYRHHHREGDERRPIQEALLDPDSQYVARSRHAERLQPFLDDFPAGQIAVVQHRDLLEDRRSTLRRVFAWLGLTPDHWIAQYRRERNAAPGGGPCPSDGLRRRFLAAVADDAARFGPLSRRLALPPAPARGCPSDPTAMAS